MTSPRDTTPGEDVPSSPEPPASPAAEPAAPPSSPTPAPRPGGYLGPPAPAAPRPDAPAPAPAGPAQGGGPGEPPPADGPRGAAGSARLGGRTPSGPDAPPPAVPRAGGPRAGSPEDPGPGWAAGRRSDETQPTTVLPSGAARSSRPVPARPATGGSARPPAASGGARPVAGRTRRARLALKRIDPWSVFLFSLVAAVFLGVALVVAVAALYAVLGSLGVTESLNQLFAEVTGGDAADEPLFTSGRIVGGAAVLAAVNVVLLTLLATLGALLYNVCASFTGGLELVFGERE